MRIRDLVIVTGWAVAAAAGAAQGQPSTLTVRVLDNAELPRDTLRQAVLGAQGIFRWAGVEMEWLPCSPSMEAEGQDMRCHQGQKKGDMNLGIAPRSMEGAFPISRWALGLAMPAPEGRPASHAFVFYGRVEDFGKRIGYPVGLLLGAAIAHEVGHLLIGPEHTAGGIMRANWKKQSMAEAARGQLRFSTEQAVRLQALVQCRAELNGPALLAGR